IADFARGLREKGPQPRPRGVHLTTNIVIALDGDTAKVRSNWTVAQNSAGGPQINSGGGYADELVKQNGKWLFRYRKIDRFMEAEKAPLPIYEPSRRRPGPMLQPPETRKHGPRPAPGWASIERRDPVLSDEAAPSRAFDKGVHDLFVAGVLEFDRQFVVLDHPDLAVAEFLVEYAVADRKPADLFHLLAAQWRAHSLDQQRPARRGPTGVRPGRHRVPH